jgi:hypothetical protein
MPKRRPTSRATLAATAALLLTIGSAPAVVAQDDYIANARIASAVFDRDAGVPTVTLAVDCLRDAGVDIDVYLTQELGGELASSWQPSSTSCVAGTTAVVPITFGLQRNAFQPGEATISYGQLRAYVGPEVWVSVDGEDLSGTKVTLIGEPAPGTTCVRFTTRQAWNPRGRDAGANLVNEWVRIKNYCSTEKSISGWKIWDRGKIHKFRFPDGTLIGPGQAIKLRTGDGHDTASNYFWDLGSAVWNNDTCRERAYLYSPVSKSVKDTWSRC